MGSGRDRRQFRGGAIVCVFAAALGLSVALTGSAAAYLYVGNGSRIVRANNDGTGAVPDFIAVDGFVCSVAVDANHVYWSDLDSVGRANIDGTDVQQNLFTVADPAKSFCGVALDGSHVYWVERHSNTIGRADLDGGNPQPSLFTAGAQPCGIAVDGTYAYFASNASGAITRFPKDGGAPVPMAWATGSAACAIAVSNTAVYYADRNASGATPIHAATTTSPSVLADVPGATAPCGIAASTSALYWTNDSLAGGSVGTVALGTDGGPVGMPNQALLTGLNGPCGLAVDSLPRSAPQDGGPTPTSTGSARSTEGTPSPGGTQPLTAFTLGKFATAKGYGTLTVKVPGPGQIRVEDNATAKNSSAARRKRALVRVANAKATGAGAFRLKIEPTSAGKVLLKRTGKLRVVVRVTYTPNSGTATSQTARIVLRARR